MPDSMNFNDPSFSGQGGAPMQGWDPNQYPMQYGDPYAQGMYPQDMQAQAAMYQNQMGYGYPDQMGAQQFYPDQYAQQNGMYYPQEAAMQQQAFDQGVEAEAERMARQQQMRASSIFGPKDRGAAAQEAENASIQNQPMGQHAQPMGVAAQGASMQSNQMQQAQANTAVGTMPQMGGAHAPQQGASMQNQMQQGAAANQQPQMQQAQQPAKSAKQSKRAAKAQQQAAMNAMNPPSNGQAVGSLVLGIFSIVLAIIPPIGMVLGWLSTRLSRKYRQRGGRSSVAYSGRIFGRVGFTFSCILLVAMLFCVVFIGGATFGNYAARSMGIYWNNSPLGQLLFLFPFN